MIKTRVDLLKSSMRGGIFPLNPNAIDRSRILRSATSTVESTARTSVSNVSSNNNHGNGSAATSDNKPGGSDHRDHDGQATSGVLNSSRSSVSSFNYQSPISTLDQVLQVLNDDRDESDGNVFDGDVYIDDDDDDFVLTNVSIRSSKRREVS